MGYSAEAVAKAEELAAVIRELGAVRSQMLRARAEVWLQNAHLGVTERRETTSAYIVEFTAQAEELNSEVEALRVELGILLGNPSVLGD